MVTEIWVNIASGNGLLPDSTKPLPKPMLTDHHWSPVIFIIRAISQEMPQPSITKIYLKITYLKFHSNFPGANEWIFVNTCSSNGFLLDGIKPLCEPKLTYCWFDPWKQNFSEIWIKKKNTVHSSEYIWKCLQNMDHFHLTLIHWGCL